MEYTVFFKLCSIRKIFNLANDIRKIEEDYYKGYKLFNNVIKYINNGRFKLVSNKLSYLLKK